MKFATIAALASAAIASPIAARDADTDLLVLQFALTLEHLEDYFYSNGLRSGAGLSKSQFKAAGYSDAYYDNLRRITDDEKSHVTFLTNAIKAAYPNVQPAVECKSYPFEALGAYSSVSAFLGLSSVIEDVGTSAYLGAANLISNKDYLTAAGSILVTEALHTSYQRDAVKKVPFATPYGTPITPDLIFNIVLPFLKDCGIDRNPTFPFPVYPTLSAPAGPYAEGASVTFTSAATQEGTQYLTFLSGLSKKTVAATSTDGGKTLTASIPKEVDAGLRINGYAGQIYVIQTDSTGAKTLAGPAIVEVNAGAPRFLNGNYVPINGQA